MAKARTFSAYISSLVAPGGTLNMQGIIQNPGTPYYIESLLLNYFFAINSAPITIQTPYNTTTQQVGCWLNPADASGQRFMEQLLNPVSIVNNGNFLSFRNPGQYFFSDMYCDRNMALNIVHINYEPINQVMNTISVVVVIRPID